MREHPARGDPFSAEPRTAGRRRVGQVDHQVGPRPGVVPLVVQRLGREVAPQVQLADLLRRVPRSASRTSAALQHGLPGPPPPGPRGPSSPPAPARAGRSPRPAPRAGGERNRSGSTGRPRRGRRPPVGAVAPAGDRVEDQPSQRGRVERVVEVALGRRPSLPVAAFPRVVEVVVRRRDDRSARALDDPVTSAASVVLPEQSSPVIATARGASSGRARTCAAS